MLNFKDDRVPILKDYRMLIFKDYRMLILKDDTFYMVGNQNLLLLHVC